MANYKKPANAFPVGNKLSNGRPKKDPLIKKAAKFTRTSIEALLTQFLYLNMDELNAVIEDAKRPTIDHFVAKILQIGIKTGDQQKLNFLLERIIGKVRDQIEHTVVRPTIIRRLDGSEVQLGAVTDGSDDT